ncbi:hypothetical protein CVS47_00432 [Microbacterium lemovicicum]|uniref:FHA domain-containing protein n=3 Tax=Microbacterium lemovicicum TaxID=1072463 RepID=A0A3S9W750_9MICO|nr:DUF5684 domain-containing protein [Microbacterium lemovicicum]AZS35834.1 hypothetical protein CVS47_00432 [Microbacterium lemovicicum]
MNASAAGDSVGLTLGLTTVVLSLALYIWTALALSAVFRKSGEESWKAWVPFLNTAVLLTLGGFSGWFVLLVLLPVLGQVVLYVILVMALHRINQAFGFGVGMTVLAALLLPVWASVVGFGSARWVGSDHTAPAPHRTGPGAERAAAAPSGRIASLATPPRPPAPPAARGYAPPVVPGYGPPALPGHGSAAGYVPGSPTRVAPGYAPPASPRSGYTPPVGVPATAPFAASDPSPWGPPANDDDGAAPGPRRRGEHPEDLEVSAIAPGVVPPQSAVSAARAQRKGWDDEDAAAAPIDVVPGARSSAPPIPPAPLVTRVPARGAEPEAEPWAPRRSPQPDVFPDTTDEVSAIASAPRAGEPRPAGASVSVAPEPVIEPVPAAPEPAAAVEDEDEDLDQTVIVHRRRAEWELVPPGGAPVAISSDVVILGRRPSADDVYPSAQLLPLVDETRTVSKTHARLELTGDGWVITDLASTNGVLLTTEDGTEQEAASGVPLPVGERFHLGDAEVRLRRTGA